MRTALAALACVVSLAASALLAQAPAPAAAAPPAGNVEKGKLTYLKVGCGHCHGREAQGSPTTGPRLAPAIPFAAFSRVVRTPPVQMPPYSEKILSNADLADIYAFVQARPKAVPAPALLQTGQPGSDLKLERP